MTYLTYPSVNHGTEVQIGGTLEVHPSGKQAKLVVLREVYDRTLAIVEEATNQHVTLRVTDGNGETVSRWKPVSALTAGGPDLVVIFEAV